MKIPFLTQERKENPVGGAFFLNNSHVYQYKNKGKEFAKEGYQENVIVYRAIREIVSAASCLKITVNKGDEPIGDHPALDLLKNPNPQQGQDSFFENIFTDFNIFGELAITKDRDGAPSELWPVSPMHINIKSGRGGIPDAYVYKNNNYEKVFPVSKIDNKSNLFFHKMYNPTDYWRGQSPLQAAGLSGDIHNKGLEWNWSLLKNGARASGILKFDGTPSGQDLNRLREYFKSAFQGSNNAGEVPILTGGGDFHELGKSPKDMDFLATMKETAKYIASAFGVPLPLIDNDASTFNNIEQAKERLYTDTVLPMMRKFLSQFGNWLLPYYGEGLKFDIDMDSIPALEGVRQRRFERMAIAVDKGIISRDEARMENGWDMRGGLADELYIQSTSVPLSGSFDTSEEIAKHMQAIGYTESEIKSILYSQKKDSE